MGEPDQALNNAGESPAPAPQTNTDDLISTVELSPAMDADNPPEGGAKPGDQGDTPADGHDPAGDPKPGEGESPDDSTRFDKHPRFVELNTRLKAAEESNKQLSAQITEIKTSQAPNSESDKPAELPYKDLSVMTDEEILDWQSEDPKGYVENINKMVAHQIQNGISTALTQNSEQTQQANMEAQVEKTYKAYATENPEFDSMWATGDIKAYMDQNPGHNAISAHMAMTSETRQQKAIDDAVAEALSKAETARRSTRKAGSILGPGPSSVPTSPKSSDDELKNPQKYGGSTSVLAARLERMRAANH